MSSNGTRKAATTTQSSLIRSLHRRKNIINVLLFFCFCSTTTLPLLSSLGGRGCHCCFALAFTSPSVSQILRRTRVSSYPDSVRNPISSYNDRRPGLMMSSPSSSSSFDVLASSHRIELFFKDPQQLKERVMFLQENLDGIQKFNLVNKHKSDDLTGWINCIRETDPNAHICCHYSLKFQKIPRAKSTTQQSKKLIDFLQNCQADEVLIVNGSGPKSPQWSTVQALQSVSTELYNRPSNNSKDDSDEKGHDLPKLAVAYNPYFPSEGNQQDENRRLQEKLQTGCVSKIYFQFGSDLDKLKQGIDFCQSMINDNKNQPVSTMPTLITKAKLAGSIFLPTKQLIAQQKFRPWNGVFLSPEFLSGPNAHAIVVEMMKLYNQNNVECLWEAPGIKTLKDVDVLHDLLLSCSPSSSNISNEKKTSANTTTTCPKTKRTKLSSDDEGISDNDISRDNNSNNKHQGQETSSATSSVKSKEIGKSSQPAILLFGSHDVRLRDNRAVEAALKHHSYVIPTFLWTSEDQGPWGVTGAAQVVLKDALRNLDSSLRSFDLSLLCGNCKSKHGVDELIALVKMYGVRTVYYNKECTPEGRERDAIRETALRNIGVTVHVSHSSLLYDPDRIELSSGFHGGHHWGTLMPFLKNCKKSFGEPPRPTPYGFTFRLLQGVKQPDVSLALVKDDSKSICWVPLERLDMAIVGGREKWDGPILQRFPMSTQAAYNAMENFVAKGLTKYEKERSRADIAGATSELSPHLRFGTISCSELYWRIEDSGLSYDKLKTFSRRLFWRDLAYFQLKCFPHMRTNSIRAHYDKTAWISGEGEERRFNAWKSGKTGYPLVDAGMRELWETGFMNQSVRMVVASFLVEYLRVNWIRGCEWFHFTLVDADSAINAMMWQNAGKSGIDQWNWVSSPVAASQDPTAAYTRRWVPELANLPTNNLVHRPWEATQEVLESAGVVLGETYPNRIVEDLKAERQLSVDSILSMRRDSQHANTDRGYDVIALPNGETTVVFTKKEYRIDDRGDLIKDGGGKLLAAAGKGSSRSRKKKSRKAL